MEIPELLKTNKAIAPYIARSIEIESVNPVVSYYCKIYILEYILSNKLHATDKSIEGYTIHLLDETELLKSSTEDEGLHRALADKTISLTLVLDFTFKLFNSCLSDLSKYDGSNKPQLVAKFRACLNFLTILSPFYNKADDSINWKKLNVEDNEVFGSMVKEKLKILKYHLTQLIKDEVKVVGEQDLEDELERELQNINALQEEGDPAEQEMSLLLSVPKSLEESSNKTGLPSAPTEIGGHFELPSAPTNLESNETGLPSAPTFIDGDIANEEETQGPPAGPSISLPGAPHILPDSSSSEDVKLPGAPQFLPDDDISHINKDSSIKVFPPKATDARKVAPRRVSSVAQNNDPPVQVHDINDIINKTEVISKAQKHAKFAISALNYEDIKTAEKELLEALSMIQNLK